MLGLRGSIRRVLESSILGSLITLSRNPSRPESSDHFAFRPIIPVLGRGKQKLNEDAEHAGTSRCVPHGPDFVFGENPLPAASWRRSGPPTYRAGELPAKP